MIKEIESIELVRNYLAELLKFIEGEENEFLESETLNQENVDKFSTALKELDNEDIKNKLSETFKANFGVDDLDDEKQIQNLMEVIKSGVIDKDKYEELAENIYEIDNYLEELEEYKEWATEPSIEEKRTEVPYGVPAESKVEEKLEEPEEILIEEPYEVPEEPTVEENLEEPEENIEKSEELPAITEYKKETERLEKELEELLSKINNVTKEDNELSEMDEIIKNTTYPEIENNDNKITEIKEEIDNINNDIIIQNEQKERYEKLKFDYDKFYDEHKIPKTNGDYRQKMEIYDNRIKECNEKIKAYETKKTSKESELEMLIAKNSEINGPLYKIETWKFSELYQKEVERLENNLKELKEIEYNYYKESKGVPLEIYGLQTKLENQIKEMKDVYNQRVGIRSEINLNSPEFKPVLEAIKNGRKLNDEVNKELDEKFRTEKKETLDEELDKNIEELKAEIEKRRANIAKYEDALNDIREIENDIKSGKKPEDEEIKNKVDIVNNKIDSITDDKLKEELREQLEKALVIEKNLPVPITNIEKKPKVTWKTIGMLTAGLGLGATIGFAAPAGVIIATGIGLAVAKWKVNKLRKAAEQRRLNGETEIKAIELPNNKVKAAIVKFKQYIKSEEGLRDIAWGLNGGLIGLALGKMAKGFTNLEELNKTSGMTSEPQIETTPDLSNDAIIETPSETIQDIRLGESIEGYDITQGHDTAYWAVNNINAETLNTDLVNGDSIFSGFRVVNPDGTLGASFTTEGTSLTEIINNTGLTPDQIAIDVAQNGQSQAWIQASDILGKGMSR